MSFKYSRAKTTLVSSILFFAGVGHSQAEAIQEAGRFDYRIEIPAGETDPATFIPVTAIRGVKPGPTLFISTGVHGYEFAPILAAEKLADDIDPNLLSGTVLLSRPSHVSAFESRSPYVNPHDKKNLNRSFPGSENGTQTERIAYALATQLIADADFVVDVHSGDGAEWLHPFIGVYGGALASDYPSALRFAEAFGIPAIVRYQMRTQAQIDKGRSLNRQGVAAGAPTILVEIGQNGGRDPEHVKAIVSGLKAGMQTLEMLPISGVRQTTQHRYYEGTHSVPVGHSGIWHPIETGGRDVTQGDVLGEIRDYSGAVVETVTATASGFAMYGLAGPPVRKGESVMTIARPVDSLD